jgi:hypothetical protein
VAPACDLLHQDLRDELFPKEKSELFALEEVGQEGVLEGGHMMEPSLRAFASLSHQKMEVDVGIYLPAEGLD